MLRCIAQHELIHEPRQVKFLHHTLAGVAVTAVCYAARSDRGAPGNNTRNYFTIAEVPTPNESGRPLNVLHVLAPGIAITSLALVRSTDGAQLYVLVQCVMQYSKDLDDKPKTSTFVYRRALVEEDDYLSESHSGLATDPHGYPRQSSEGRMLVCYQRLPHAMEGEGHAWTVALGFSVTENIARGAEKTDPLVVAAGGSAAFDQSNVLQFIHLQGTRARVQQTLEIPVLSRYEVNAIIQIPGSSDRLLVLCHHAVVEVDRRRIADTRTAPGTVVSNDAVTRAWKWTPHDRLTCCCLRDHLLYAGTESGVVVIWDMRLPNGGDTTESQWVFRSDPMGAAITGIYAPNAMDFVTCGLDGSILAWSAQQDGGLRALVSGRHRYAPRLPKGAASTIAGGEGCVAMSGDGDLVAVVSEYGHLRLFLCTWEALHNGAGQGVVW